MESKEELTPEELKKKAYLMGLRLKNSGLDAETIYARLEKQGIPEDLARQVAQDAMIERKREIVKETEPTYNFALIRILIGIIIALVSYLIFPNNFILPSGIILGGIVSALLAKKRMNEINTTPPANRTAVLDSFKGNKKAETEPVKAEEPSPKQILFSDTALEIISPSVESFGFVRHKIEIETYAARIVFRKDNQYIKISSNTHPLDHPSYYNLILGEGDSEDFFEYDWNSIALWRLKAKLDPDSTPQTYSFPTGDEVRPSLTKANEELLKYGLSFLKGDLTLFYETRKAQNRNREPYKIHSPDKNAKYQTTNEPKSASQKEKYS